MLEKRTELGNTSTMYDGSAVLEEQTPAEESLLITTRMQEPEDMLVCRIDFSHIGDWEICTRNYDDTILRLIYEFLLIF